MKKIVAALVFNLCMVLASAQSRSNIDEDMPANIDGVEVGYIITEEDNRTAGKEEFARFKITLYANNGGCARMFRLRESNQSVGAAPGNVVATFFVRNANGKRLTSRESRLTAREWWIPVRVKERNSEGKEITVIREMMGGYIFREGDHLESSIIVLVPQGERPKVDVILARASDL